VIQEAAAIGEFGVWYVVFLLTLTLHEGAHALAARLGGDDLAYRSGQVSLNPLPHMRREPFGTILIPILTFFVSGWMMGWASTPYDPAWGRRNPRRLAAMSAAGPAANLLLALTVFAVLRGLLSAGLFTAPDSVSFSHVVEPPRGTPPESLAHAVAFTLSVALNLNLLLFLFNLVPLPPLDGGGIVRGLFPDTIGALFESLSGQPIFSMLGLLAAWQLFDFIYRPAFGILLRLLHPGVSYGA
jgi:Zn-dependent protease